MPTVTVYDPIMNPERFYPLQHVQPAKYVSRFMDDWHFRRTIQPWDEKVCFLRPWYTTDSIKLQYTTDSGDMTLSLYDENGYHIVTQPFQTMQQNELQPTFFIRQIALNLAPYPPGKYFLKRTIAGVERYSNPFELMDPPDSGLIELDDEDPTLLMEFSNWEPSGGIKWFAPFEGAARFPAILKFKGMTFVDTLYFDQNRNATMVKSVPARLFTLAIGGRYGIPPWMEDLAGRIMTCSEWKLDQRLFTKAAANAEFEPVPAELYPMKGVSIDVVEKLNRDVIISEDEVTVEGVYGAALMTDTKGFGLNPGPTDYQEIISLQ